MEIRHEALHLLQQVHRSCNIPAERLQPRQRHVVAVMPGEAAEIPQRPDDGPVEQCPGQADGPFLRCRPFPGPQQPPQLEQVAEPQRIRQRPKRPWVQHLPLGPHEQAIGAQQQGAEVGRADQQEQHIGIAARPLQQVDEGDLADAVEHMAQRHIRQAHAQEDADRGFLARPVPFHRIGHQHQRQHPWRQQELDAAALRVQRDAAVGARPLLIQVRDRQHHQRDDQPATHRGLQPADDDRQHAKPGGPALLGTHVQRGHVGGVRRQPACPAPAPNHCHQDQHADADMAGQQRGGPEMPEQPPPDVAQAGQNGQGQHPAQQHLQPIEHAVAHPEVAIGAAYQRPGWQASAATAPSGAPARGSAPETPRTVPAGRNPSPKTAARPCRSLRSAPPAPWRR